MCGIVCGILGGYPVWTEWGSVQRDVYFLNRTGGVDTTFNITPYSPSNPEDYTYIMNLILDLRDEHTSSVLNVPGDYPTIQGGIDAANDGDVVLVADKNKSEDVSKIVERLMTKKREESSTQMRFFILSGLSTVSQSS